MVYKRKKEKPRSVYFKLFIRPTRKHRKIRSPT